MRLRLEHNNLTLQTLEDSALPEEGLKIGRAKGCAWRTPSNDGSISGEHLRIYRKGKAIWLEDLGSTNGVFLRGKRIQKRKVEVGDQFSFGNACLSAEADPGAAGGAGGPSWIVLGSPQGGKRKFILDKPVTTIGSSPEADVRFPSELVSQRHAEIRRQSDGGYWLIDLHSKNGTTVNDIPLAAEKERLLKEGDKVSIAQYEFTYYDGAIVRANSHLGLKVAVILIALAVSWGGYRIYQELTPAAVDFVRRAEQRASRADFTGALEELGKAVGGRGYRERELEISTLRRSILEWQSVHDGWNKAMAHLAEREWIPASRLLAGIATKGKEAWSWNDEAPDLRARAIEARSHLDALLIALNASRRDEVDPEFLQGVVRSGRSTLDALADTTVPYLVPLREDLRPALDALEKLQASDAALNQALERLLNHPAPVSEILAAVEQIRGSATGAVRRKAEAVLPPLRALSASNDRVMQAAASVIQLRLDETATLDPALPSVEACAVDPRVSQARINIHFMAENLKNSAMELKTLLARLGDLPPDGTPPAPLAALSNAENLEKALACDAFDLPLPRRTRTRPESAYDALLGVEEFYLRLQALPEPFDPEVLGGMPAFTPELRRLDELCRQAQRLISWLEEERNTWLRHGRIQQIEKAARKLLQDRERLVASWARRLNSADGRQQVILGGMIATLASSPDFVSLNNQPPAAWTVSRFQQLRSEINALNRQYMEAAPDRKIELRDVMLRTGLPGDGVLRSLWSDRDRGREKSGSD